MRRLYSALSVLCVIVLWPIGWTRRLYLALRTKYGWYLYIYRPTLELASLHSCSFETHETYRWQSSVNSMSDHARVQSSAGIINNHPVMKYILSQYLDCIRQQPKDRRRNLQLSQCNTLRLATTFGGIIGKHKSKFYTTTLLSVHMRVRSSGGIAIKHIL